MEVYQSIESCPELDNSVLTIGSYDGLHRGHHEVVRNVVSHAKALKTQSIVVTFDPHPRHLLDPPADKWPLIMSMDQKIKVLQSLDVDIVLAIPFTKPFSKTTAQLFMDHIILPKLNPKKIIIGYDHHFGFKREGTPAFLSAYCHNHQIDIDIMKPIKDEDIVISSSRIRELILSGFIRRANYELGSIYGIAGRVCQGSGQGKGLNFPTANIQPIEKNQLLPKPGVYFVRGRIIGLSPFGMCNFGIRPTFDEQELVIEVHFFQEQLDDIYDKIIMVEFLERIRDEKKFPSPNKLIEQLKKDKARCLELQAKYE